MKRYSTQTDFNIDYDEIEKKFYISSVHGGNRPMIGGFATAAQAIDFGNRRVKQLPKGEKI